MRRKKMTYSSLLAMAIGVCLLAACGDPEFGQDGRSNGQVIPIKDLERSFMPLLQAQGRRFQLRDTPWVRAALPGEVVKVRSDKGQLVDIKARKGEVLLRWTEKDTWYSVMSGLQYQDWFAGPAGSEWHPGTPKGLFIALAINKGQLKQLLFPDSLVVEGWSGKLLLKQGKYLISTDSLKSLDCMDAKVFGERFEEKVERVRVKEIPTDEREG